MPPVKWGIDMDTGLPLAFSCNLIGVSGNRSLSREENARVVAAVRALLDSKKWNQTTLAPEIGMKQPTLSALMRGKHQAGYGTARLVAKISGQHVDVLLGGQAPVGDESSPLYENLSGWSDAMRIVRKKGYPEWAIKRAGRLRGLVPPVVDEAFATTAVQHVMTTTPPEEEIALAIAETEAKYKGAETRARKRITKG